MRYIAGVEGAKARWMVAFKPAHALANISKRAAFDRSDLRRVVNIFGVFVAQCKALGVQQLGVAGIYPQNSRQAAPLLRCQFLYDPIQPIGIKGNGRREQVGPGWTLYEQPRTSRHFTDAHDPVGREAKRTEKGRKIAPRPFVGVQKHIAQVPAVRWLNRLSDHFVAAFCNPLCTGRRGTGRSRAAVASRWR